MSDIVAKIEAIARAPPSDSAERLALYNAAKELANAVEDPFDTIFRIQTSPMVLTFAHTGSELGLFEKLAESSTPLTTVSLAKSADADPVLVGRILRYLASHKLILETDEDTFAANNVTQVLAKPGFKAGLAHGYEAHMPSLGAVAKFLSDTKYANPSNPLHSAFQAGHRTDKLAWVYAVEQPKMFADFNLWMATLHDSARTFLDVFDFPSYVGGGSADAPLFVDIGGGIGQQCALLKKVHPGISGRMVLQDQPFVIANAMPIEGVETEVFDFFDEQPHKGARVFYMRNVLHDFPDPKATQIMRNIMPAMTVDSVLVIDEIIVPNRGAHPRATEMDLAMMSSMASIERTEKQWNELLDQAGFKILRKATYDDKTGMSAIVTVPKST